MDAAEMPRIPGLTLLRQVGAGSTGTVYAARRDLDGWNCAVKVAGDLDPQARTELVHEAAVLGSVRLPHLIALHEVLETSDGRVALVLDLIDGGNVGALAGQRDRLTPAETVTVLAPLLRTLAELHRRGIVHGDVSASNVLLTREGRPMLTDLGRARLVGQRPTAARGTREYLAPEVNAPGPPTAAADVYAAGALGWRLITGEPVPAGLVRRPLSTVVASAPTALGFVIDDCLRGDPTVRPTADRAADAVLEACRATPLQLPDGADPAEQLTFRLREGLGRAPYRPPTSGQTQRAQPSRGRIDVSDAAGRHRLAGRRATHVGLRLIRHAAPWLTGLAAFAAATAGVFAVVRPLADQAASRTVAGLESVTPSGAPPAPTTFGPSRTPSGVIQPSTMPFTGPARTPSTGAAEPSAAELLAEFSGLVEMRARAYRDANPAYLTRVFLPGSPDGAAAQSEVKALQRSGARYEGLRYLPVSPRLEGVGRNECLIRARIDTSRYVVRQRGVASRVRPAARGVPVRLKLARTPNGWRIASVLPG